MTDHSDPTLAASAGRVSVRDLQRSRHRGLRLVLAAALACAWGLACATSYDFIGSGYAWPDEADWVPIDGANDPDDGLAREQLDVVGDATDPAAYRYDDGAFVHFRMRLDIGSVDTGNPGTFSDSHLVLIDVVGQHYDPTLNNNYGGLSPGEDIYPDYGFAWDSNSNDPLKHGLEMVVRDVTDNTWNGINMDDIDGTFGQKLANDINGDGRTTDGYVRATWDTPETSTTSFDTTTFLDFAVSWTYLTTYTDLRRDQEWNVVFATISNATDHNNINGDLSGGANVNDPATEGWTPIEPVPTPAPLVLLLPGLALLWRRQRRFRA